MPVTSTQVIILADRPAAGWQFDTRGLAVVSAAAERTTEFVFGRTPGVLAFRLGFPEQHDT